MGTSAQTYVDFQGRDLGVLRSRHYLSISGSRWRTNPWDHHRRGIVGRRRSRGENQHRFGFSQDAAGADTHPRFGGRFSVDFRNTAFCSSRSAFRVIFKNLAHPLPCEHHGVPAPRWAELSRFRGFPVAMISPCTQGWMEGRCQNLAEEKKEKKRASDLDADSRARIRLPSSRSGRVAILLQACRLVGACRRYPFPPRTEQVTTRTQLGPSRPRNGRSRTIRCSATSSENPESPTGAVFSVREDSSRRA